MASANSDAIAAVIKGIVDPFDPAKLAEFVVNAFGLSHDTRTIGGKLGAHVKDLVADPAFAATRDELHRLGMEDEDIAARLREEIGKLIKGHPVYKAIRKLVADTIQEYGITLSNSPSSKATDAEHRASLRFLERAANSLHFTECVDGTLASSSTVYRLGEGKASSPTTPAAFDGGEGKRYHVLSGQVFTRIVTMMDPDQFSARIIKAQEALSYFNKPLAKILFPDTVEQSERYRVANWLEEVLFGGELTLVEVAPPKKTPKKKTGAGSPRKPSNETLKFIATATAVSGKKVVTPVKTEVSVLESAAEAEAEDDGGDAASEYTDAVEDVDEADEAEAAAAAAVAAAEAAKAVAAAKAAKRAKAKAKAAEATEAAAAATAAQPATETTTTAPPAAKHHVVRKTKRV